MNQPNQKHPFVRRQNLFFRLFFESNFLLSLGFIAVLVMQTLWIIARTASFSTESTPIIFRDALIICFSTAISCFAVYFICFYFFVITNRLAWKFIRQNFLIICGAVFCSLAISQLSLIRVITPTLLSKIKPARMFIYFFPFLIITAFAGITSATTFMLRCRHNQIRSQLKSTTSTNVENKTK